GLYAAARGDRGGLFVFGVEGGFRKRPWPEVPLELEAGIFVGGGGGAAAPQGGGLMLRPHVGLTLALGRLRLGAELSRVRFPSGAIDSTQAAFTLAWTSQRLWSPLGAWGEAFAGPVTWEGRSFALEALRVEPARGALTRGGAPQGAFDLAGFRATAPLAGPFSRSFALAGAAGGQAPGYAQATAGLGGGWRVAGPLRLELLAEAGFGGGGDLDTGGGLIWGGRAQVVLALGAWRATAGGGYERAPAGRFAGRYLAVSLGRSLAFPRPDPGGALLAAAGESSWTFGSGLLVLRSAARQSGVPEGMQLITLRADRLLGHGLYVSAEAGSATGGGAGGYSNGLVGLGWQTPALGGQRLFLEGAAGAGGGGGVATRGGWLVSGRAGWRAALPLGLQLEASAGRLRAPGGGLDTATYGVALGLRFSLPEQAWP
ncbi:MAG TPA: hypothetical protein VFT46_00445, partial [Holophagaceae bacterium]|nr:hypothetical protein [Holophagaceae bacterium]